jgi:hypothetical protein
MATFTLKSAWQSKYFPIGLRLRRCDVYPVLQ